MCRASEGRATTHSDRQAEVIISQAPARQQWSGPASKGPSFNAPPLNTVPLNGPSHSFLHGFQNQGLPTAKPFIPHTNPPTFPSLATQYGQRFPSQGMTSAQPFSSHSLTTGQSLSGHNLPASRPLKHQLSHTGFNSHLGQTPFSQQSSLHAGQGGLQGSSSLHPPGGYSQAQMQAMLASCMPRDEHKEEAMLGAAACDPASISRWLQQGHDASGISVQATVVAPHGHLHVGLLP